MKLGCVLPYSTPPRCLMSPGTRELSLEKDRDAGRVQFTTENQYFYPQSYRLGWIERQIGGKIKEKLKNYFSSSQ